MIAVIVLFGVEILTILFLGLEKVNGPQDVWVYVMGIAAIIGAYISLRMESQKNKMILEQFKIDNDERDKKITDVKIEVKNKVDGSFCVQTEREHKKEMTGLAIMMADLSKELKEDMNKMNQKIDDNHNEMLNTILSIVTNKVIK